MTEAELVRAHAVDAARRWIGTPYRHRASLMGAGADCLGVVRGVWRMLCGAEAEMPPAYAPLWAETGAGEALRDGLARHMRALPVEAAQAGDVMLFRFAPGAAAKHAAVLSGGGRMVHAYAGRGVVETPLGPWWLRRRAWAFGFPAAR
ncbi:MAG: C40 family peptidase [Alphaproteobacteria bacterium]|nr:C40 family peptidase [Alphaproteobacteria bacterium]